MSETKTQEKVEGLKIKKPSYKRPNNQVFKLDLTKKEEDAVKEQSADEISVRDESETSEEVSKENVKETNEELTTESKEEEVSPLTEVVNETVEEKPTAEVETPKVNLPENIEKLVQFMEETGGNIEDYVRLNTDYSKVNPDTLLVEYYKSTKPHLDKEEIEFLFVFVIEACSICSKRN